ncbi:MAG: twin-arginine translocase TatA/TatE family subunit [Saprospiraceae bacterium]|nr:twin-arginine translocase TatA/TatE family subunit [Saprospiraceae bacterium]
MLGGTEWLVIFFAVLLLFGGKKIPELMRGIGKGIREFNAARSSIESELKQGMREAELQHQRQLEEQKKQIEAQQKQIEEQQKLLQQQEEPSSSEN